jgi:hypothetical protein
MTPLPKPPATNYRIYLPHVINQGGYPDLVIDHVSSAGGNIQVVIKNIGGAAATAAFWVDVYINPVTPPSRVNQTWNIVGTQGLVWGIPGAALPLAPGATLTLRIGDAYYRPEYSRQTKPIAKGMLLFAQVDSFDAATTYGGVLEAHEADGSPYNNISNAPAQDQVLPANSAPAADIPASDVRYDRQNRP